MSQTKDIKVWEQSQTDHALECRDFGHAWVPYHAEREPTGFFELCSCARYCGNEMIRHYNRRGEIIKRTMLYDPNYLRPKGSGFMSKQERAKLRIVRLKRKLS